MHNIFVKGRVNPFLAIGFFLYPHENIRKTTGFLMFSGGIEKDQWNELGEILRMLTAVVPALSHGDKFFMT